VTYGKLSVTRIFDFVAGGFSKNLGLEYVHNFGVMVGIRLVSAIPTIEFLQWIENGLADLYERWTDPHRTPVAAGFLADLRAKALNNFLKIEK
jgi:hypothetical protein